MDERPTVPTQQRCPKCNYVSGNDWKQCDGDCPMIGSPHYAPEGKIDWDKYLRPEPVPYPWKEVLLTFAVCLAMYGLGVVTTLMLGLVKL